MAEDDEETWRTQPHYPEVVELLKRDMALELQELTDDTTCFGHAWIDSDGECPEAGECALASFCKQAWKMVQVSRGRSAMAPPQIQTISEPIPKPPPKPDNPYVAAHKGSIAKPSKARPLGRPKNQERNKYANSTKFERKGYTDMGRKVDELVAVFVEGIGDPPHLPLIWNAKNFDEKYSDLGPVVLSAARNFHTVHYEGIKVLRFWTNAAKHAIVDLTPTLLADVAAVAKTLGEDKYGNPQMEPPTKVPTKSWDKLRPCTHRVIVRTPEAAMALANILRQTLSF